MSASVQGGRMGGASIQGVDGMQPECLADADCQSLSDAMATCEEPDSCQGTKPVMHCVVGTCTSRTFTDADDACTEAIERDDCGRYKSIFCSGETEQGEVACPTSCSDDDDCDPGAICAAGDCIATESLRDGESCADDDECKSGHCQNGYCCERGDCCRAATQCPMGYRSEPQCSNPASCQGIRLEPSCQQNTCGSAMVEDDSACTRDQAARRCPESEDVMCTGDAQQPPPPECPEPDRSTDEDSPVPSPTPAPRPTPTPTPTPMPTCDPPECCTDSRDCGGPTEHCMDPSSCQGSRILHSCESGRCVDREVEDDSACAGQLRDDCGPAGRDLVCTSAQSQPLEERCFANCVNEPTACDQGAVCLSGSCTIRCSSNEDCAELARIPGNSGIGLGCGTVGGADRYCIPGVL
jgi:hypothetical protein